MVHLSILKHIGYSSSQAQSLQKSFPPFLSGQYNRYYQGKSKSKPHEHQNIVKDIMPNSHPLCLVQIQAVEPLFSLNSARCQGFASFSSSDSIKLPILLARILHESVSRDLETGNPLAGLSGAQRALWNRVPLGKFNRASAN